MAAPVSGRNIRKPKRLAYASLFCLMSGTGASQYSRKEFVYDGSMLRVNASRNSTAAGGIKADYDANCTDAEARISR